MSLSRVNKEQESYSLDSADVALTPRIVENKAATKIPEGKVAQGNISRL